MTQAKRSRLNPIGALVLTRERIQEVLDDAVERGRMTRDDAQDLLAELVRRGTGPADRLIRAAGLGSPFPIDEYDDMTAAQVTEHSCAPCATTSAATRTASRCSQRSIVSCLECPPPLRRSARRAVTSSS